MGSDSENRAIDAWRASANEPQNHVIDEFRAGRLGRREFLRVGAVAGLSVSAMGFLAACGSSGPESSGGSTSGGSTSGSTSGGSSSGSTSGGSSSGSTSGGSSSGSTSGGSSSGSGQTSAPAGKPGATIRVGMITPTGQINPLTIADEGGIGMLCQTGEYLCMSGSDLQLKPALATKWSSNDDGSVWTFTLRKGVKFHNGQTMSADDVVYTYKINSDPKSSASALSAFNGVLKPEGVRKVDDMTVAFHLEAPNGNFPYLTANDNYNMIIIPNNYDPTKWQSEFMGTGPFKLKSYQAKRGASFVRNEDYWGDKALPAETDFTFYDAQQAENLALQGGTVDVVAHFYFGSGQSLINGPYTIINVKTSANRQMSMRCDTKPFTDKRVRQAFALALNRKAIVKGIYGGYAVPGNDSPFAPVFPSTDTSVPQRTQDLKKAKSLLEAAGHGGGLSATLTTESVRDLPALAQAIQADMKKIGVTLKLKTESLEQYYGKAVFGQSDWLDSTVSMVDYGERSVPNVFLTAALKSDGAWNAAHFKNPDFDKLADQYIAAIDLQSQKKVAGKIQRMLLDESPIIFPVFYNRLSATAKSVTGVQTGPSGQIFLAGASKS